MPGKDGRVIRIRFPSVHGSGRLESLLHKRCAERDFAVKTPHFTVFLP
jgi:hypothetical protein